MTPAIRVCRLSVHSRCRLHKHRPGAKHHLQHLLLVAQDVLRLAPVVHRQGLQELRGQANRLSQAKGSLVQPVEALGMAGAEVEGVVAMAGAEVWEAGAGEVRGEAAR